MFTIHFVPIFNPKHSLPMVDASHFFELSLQDTIYTNVADVLISVNPYKNIPLLYEVPLQQMQDESGDEFEESDGERQVIYSYRAYSFGWQCSY